MRRSTMPWIEIIPPEEATGRLAEAYQWQAQRLGQPTEFTQLGSLEPEIVHARLVLYKATENTSSQLSDRQKNLASHVTSLVNQTPHCTSRSRIKLRQLGIDGALLDDVEELRFEELPPGEAAVARYAEKLTRDPGAVSRDDIEDLRRAGLGDHEILDVNNQVAHLNYTNRVANGLGLLSEVAADFPAFDTVPA
jgi:uncharacterized peroxidase-related enzyme